MLTRQQIENYQQIGAEALQKVGFVVTDAEKHSLEIADFGLSDFENMGLIVLVYVNTERCCAKELVMLPGQTCPEHIHPTLNGVPGKEETFRCRAGTCYLYVDGEKNCEPQLSGLDAHQEWLKIAHQIVLNPGEQYTLQPDTKHWFRAGENGAIVSEFSTRSTDDLDIFSDPRIKRATKIMD